MYKWLHVLIFPKWLERVKSIHPYLTFQVLSKYLTFCGLFYFKEGMIIAGILKLAVVQVSCKIQICPLNSSHREIMLETSQQGGILHNYGRRAGRRGGEQSRENSHKSWCCNPAIYCKAASRAILSACSLDSGYIFPFELNWIANKTLLRWIVLNCANLRKVLHFDTHHLNLLNLLTTSSLVAYQG